MTGGLMTTRFVPRASSSAAQVRQKLDQTPLKQSGLCRELVAQLLR